MKHILVNLKRFDIPPERGGVNRIAPSGEWARTIVEQVETPLAAFPGNNFVFFLPEIHLIPALAARRGALPVIGCQSVSGQDTAPGGNFGAFTTQRTANSMASAGVQAALVGHSEERASLRELFAHTGSGGDRAKLVDTEISSRAHAAQAAGLQVTLCIGESLAERDRWRAVLHEQLAACLPSLDPTLLTLAYEPIWAIGPGKTPPDRDQIGEVARFVKSLVPDVPLVYGGGLKAENAAEVASIPDLDGGLIALTRFVGDIGFYPEEFLQIVATYFAHEETTDAN